MCCILDPCAFVLGCNLSIMIGNHGLQIADHRPEQGDPSHLLAGLELLPANQTVCDRHVAGRHRALSQNIKLSLVRRCNRWVNADGHHFGHQR